MLQQTRSEVVATRYRAFLGPLPPCRRAGASAGRVGRGGMVGPRLLPPCPESPPGGPDPGGAAHAARERRGVGGAAGNRRVHVGAAGEPLQRGVVARAGRQRRTGAEPVPGIHGTSSPRRRQAEASGDRGPVAGPEPSRGLQPGADGGRFAGLPSKCAGLRRLSPRPGLPRLPLGGSRSAVLSGCRTAALPEVRHCFTAVVQRGDDLLLHRRPEDADWLAGRWHLPTVELESGEEPVRAAEVLGREFGGCWECDERPVLVRHAVTYRDFLVRAAVARWRPERATTGRSSLAWFGHEEIEALPTSSLLRKTLDAVGVNCADPPIHSGP